MIVTIAVAILMASISNAFFDLKGDNERSPKDVLDDVVKAIRNYKGLIKDGASPGIFSTEKLENLNSKTIALELNIKYELKIEVCERSSYSEEISWSHQTSELPDMGEYELLSSATPAGLDYFGQVHSGILIVSIWGWEE